MVILNADVGLALDHGLDQVVHVVFDHGEGGLSVNDDVGCLLYTSPSPRD